MKLTEAFKLFGFDDTQTQSDLTAKWRDLRSKHHPDRGGDQDLFIQLSKAKELIEAHLEKPKRCDACDGTGKKTTSRGFHTLSRPCTKCKGTGELKRSRA